MTLLKLNRPLQNCDRSNLDALSRWQEEVERFFNTPFAAFRSPFAEAWAPALDVSEDKESVSVSLEVPGMKKEDFRIELHDSVLSISGERRLEHRRKEVTGYRTERFSGEFRRAIRLPKAVVRDQIKASYKDGILTVTLPLAVEARPRQIVVNAE
jgi:HSP20 family protein